MKAQRSLRKSKESMPAETTPSKGLVLLAEDDETISNMIASLLRRISLTVVQFTKGLDAVAYFQEHHEKVSLVVSDFKLPDLSGEDVCQRIRRCDEDVAIMICSGFDPAIEAIERLAGSGPCHFLRKPFSPEEIIDSVQRLLRDTPEPVFD
jgi:DNA-binding response OmpR family regulator